LMFPRPTPGGRAGAGGRGLAGEGGLTSEERSLNSESKSDSRSTSTNSNESTNTSATNRTEQNQSNQSSTSSNKTSNDSRSSTSSADKSERTESYHRIEKIERVESGDAIQKELDQFKVYGLALACAILALLVFTAFAAMRPKSGGTTTNVSRVIQELASDPVNSAPAAGRTAGPDPSQFTSSESSALLARRIEIEQLRDELMRVFAEQPKVARHVFSRLLTEDGVETVSAYIHIFGESIVLEMLRDPSLQADMSELMEFHAKNSNELTDEDKIELLRKLHNRTVSGKLFVMGSRSSHLFDFLSEMDGLQIMELVRNESLTVKAMVLTQCDLQKRAQIYAQLEGDARMNLLTELSRIDYLPRDYILNAASALKRKKRDNPRLNTEALPGSEVLLTLLERTSAEMARVVVRNLEMNSPEVARAIKSRLVTLDTLRHLRDGQLLEVVLSLRHDELLQFLKNAPAEVKATIMSKSPKDLASELEEELETIPDAGRDNYQAIERKLLNRIKLMANEGQVNLVDTNDRMMSESQGDGATRAILSSNNDAATSAAIKKVSGW
jgi:flagellar motor switch protein FliG